MGTPCYSEYTFSLSLDVFFVFLSLRVSYVIDRFWHFLLSQALRLVLIQNKVYKDALKSFLTYIFIQLVIGICFTL